MNENIEKTATYYHKNWIFPKDENGHISMSTAYMAGIDEFIISIYKDNNITMSISKNGIAKNISVLESSEFVYKISSNRIYARRGANGLFDFIEDALCNGTFGCMAWKILYYIMDGEKEEKRRY